MNKMQTMKALTSKDLVGFVFVFFTNAFHSILSREGICFLYTVHNF